MHSNKLIFLFFSKNFMLILLKVENLCYVFLNNCFELKPKYFKSQSNLKHFVWSHSNSILFLASLRILPDATDH